MTNDLTELEDHRAGAEMLETDDRAADSPAEAPKKRACLRCSGKFASDWAGERICPRCKGSSAWKNGSPLHTGVFNDRVR
jgi:DnaJ-class molecular chaperone